MALIDQDATIRALVQLHEETGVKTAQAIRVVREMPEADALSSEQVTQANDPNTLSALDCVSRQAAIDALKVAYFDEKIQSGKDDPCVIDAMTDWSIRQIKALPSAQPELLTDKEQRIFLAAMGREEKVCKEVDAEMTREPYEDSLVRVCREIERKVKKGLWTN